MKRNRIKVERDIPLRQGAQEQVKKGWTDGPRPCTSTGELLWNGRLAEVNPAFRFGLKQGEKLRAAGDLKQSETTKTAAIRTPI